LFTGTLLSTRGSTINQGHLVIEPYVYSTRYGGLYNNNYRLQSTPATQVNIQQTYLIYGLTSRIDVEIAPQWVGNHSGNESFVGFGDFPLRLGFQLIRDRPDSWQHDVRIWAQETFPTGHFTQLTPTKAGLPGSGGGSFATTVGIACWVGPFADRSLGKECVSIPVVEPGIRVAVPVGYCSVEVDRDKRGHISGWCHGGQQTQPHLTTHITCQHHTTLVERMDYAHRLSCTARAVLELRIEGFG